MRKENQLKSCGKKMLSSREVVARDLPHPTPLSLLNRKQQPYFMREAEDPGTLRAAKLSGMTPNFKGVGPGLRPSGAPLRSGFTLIELLVVVLIIGILAAVALPQYTLAVNKTRFASLRSTAHALIKASEAYFLANNTWATDFDSLALDLPAAMTTSTVNGGTCGVNNEMYCCVVPKGGFNPAIVCGRNDYSFAFHALSDRNNPNWREYCIAKQADARAVKLCKSLGTSGNASAFFTPEGAKTGYMYYTLKE